MLVPCGSCPWRKSSPVGGAGIDGFSIELMRGLACTVGEDDWFRRIMACHYSPVGEERACVGYLAVEGYSNLNVRMEVLRGLDLPAIWEACAELELWPSFAEMLAAYEEAASLPDAG